jgi:hypothetical protein
MIHHQLDETESILIVAPQGPLAADDFGALAAEVDHFIERKGGLEGLMLEAPAFPGWEGFGGLTAHLRFVRDHHRLIRRVAVVSDSPVLSQLPQLASHWFAAGVRRFPQTQRARALARLREA